MTAQSLTATFQACQPDEQFVLALLAAHNAEPATKTVAELCRAANLKNGDGTPHTMDSIEKMLARLARLGLSKVVGKGHSCAEGLAAPAVRAAQAAKNIDRITLALDFVRGGDYHSDTRQLLGRLRFDLLQGRDMLAVRKRLEACERLRDAEDSHPLLQACGCPPDPDMFACLHPELRMAVMWVALLHARSSLDRVPEVVAWAEQEWPKSVALVEKHGKGSVAAAYLTRCQCALVEIWILSGRLGDVAAMPGLDGFASGQLLRACARLLAGDLEPAARQFEAAMKELRKETGRRSLHLIGLSGSLYTLALLRSADPKLRKQAMAYLDHFLDSGVDRTEGRVHIHLQALRDAQDGLQPNLPEDGGSYHGGDAAAQLIVALVWHWLGREISGAQIGWLKQLEGKMAASGLHWLAAQIGGLLGRLGDPKSGEAAAALRRKFGMDDMSAWYAPQEPWERQLEALIGFHGTAPAAARNEGNTRMVWLLRGMTRSGCIIEPREQKLDARGNWTKGRAVAMSRLQDWQNQLAYLTEHDRRAVMAIITSEAGYFFTDALNSDVVLPALVGHPALYWADAPDVRVELLAAELTLSVEERGGMLRLNLQPDIAGYQGALLLRKESPTRLRLLQIKDEHRRIANIVGAGMSVPAQARERVLTAISSVSSAVTVQSGIGGGAANVRQVEADPRLHIHLLPLGQGLKAQVLVRPLPDGGPWCSPGVGAESLIAEVGGAPLQARRDLAAERAAESSFIAACPTLGKAERVHGEWLLEQPEDCLELLLEIQSAQAKDAGGIVLAWPEGQTFKVGSRFGSRQLRMSIKGERDWFAAGGELQVEEGRVLDLRQLLELLKHGHGRFLKLGEREFLALTDEFHRRLTELAALGELHGKGVRLHPLAAFALEDLANSADGSGAGASGGADGAVGTGSGGAAGGGLKADKLWKAHLARLRGLETFRAAPPGTLQAELRDYQLAGFEWLARLAHWGVGACLADDMGLGKTVQALALLLHRAPQGPALVVAPTSVCMNWLAEAARFAPTLNVTLFGGTGRGRQETLADPQPFELVVTSYGLLQQEAEQFAAVQWHTIVLDEAQAIKNAQTKRSQAVMALQGNFRMAATGTPLENHLGELWNLFRFINPGLLGSLEQFNTRFASPIERGQGTAEQSAARARLRRLIQPFILRRTKTQVLSELPSRTEILLPVELSPEEAALYQALRVSALEKLAALSGPAVRPGASAAGALNRGGNGGDNGGGRGGDTGGGKGGIGQQTIQILAEIMKLRRACCNPHLVAPELGLPSSKLAAFAELLDGLLENRHKALVFSQFVDHLALIRAHLDQRGIPYQYLDGATPMQERKKRVDAFQAGEGDVFLISLKAGGMGINLTAADYVIHMDPWWNPAVEDQASDRAHRMGQMRPVTIYRLVARNTIEETIVDLHKHKRDLADSLLEGSEMAAKLSAEEMMAMLRQGLQ